VRAGSAVLWALALLIAGFLWLAPYDRALVGREAGVNRLVDSSCPAPLGAAVFGSSDRTVSASGEWASGEAPCRRSATFRVGLGALVGLGGAGTAATMVRRSQRRSGPH
jgi:hypothetical protein